MTSRTFTRVLLSLAAITLAAAATTAQSSAPPDKTPPPNQPGANLPQDKHEGMIVSANAYTDPERAKEKFGKSSPLPVGILPVEVFLHNDTMQPIRVDTSTIQLSISRAANIKISTGSPRRRWHRWLRIPTGRRRPSPAASPSA